jgi:hypothetical protein
MIGEKVVVYAYIETTTNEKGTARSHQHPLISSCYMRNLNRHRVFLTPWKPIAITHAPD